MAINEREVQRRYSEILRRDADADGLAYYSGFDNPQKVERALYASSEFEELAISGICFDGRVPKKKRILLFGAFGNGNLGDQLQAESLSRLVALHRPDAEIWACSEMSGPFPFRHERVLAPHRIRDPRIINQFDLIIVGGGGLFGVPHEPLFDESWQTMLNVPVAVFGVGADHTVTPFSRLLLEKCVHVSGRDADSIAALEIVRKPVEAVPDPIFADKTLRISGTERSHNIDTLGRAKIRNLWVLNWKVLAKDIQDFLDLFDPNMDEVCFFSAPLDFAITTIVPQARLVGNAQEFMDLINRSDVVITTRYHGCIFALQQFCPVVGIFENKIKTLLSEFGCADAFAENIRSVRPALDRPAVISNTQLDDVATIAETAMSNLLKQVFASLSS